MKIVADRDIFQVESLFSPLGELILLPGREITPAHVRDADALLVRTVTRVNEFLVRDSAVRFVGSATSGVDHVDRDYLAEHDIHFCHAPGCNADAVVNYVIAAMAWLAEKDSFDWRRLSVGIVGAGNVGSRLAQLFSGLDMSVAIHDPLLDDSHPLAGLFTSLEEVLAKDVVTLHVPLTGSDPYPTYHMLDRERLSLLSGHAILINTARGEVIDNELLQDFMVGRPHQKVVMDVWEHEPAVNRELVGQVAIATPHIAGYSLNGKRKGTAAVFSEFCRFFKQAGEGAGPEPVSLALALSGENDESGILNQAVLQAYPIGVDFLDPAQQNLAGHFEYRRNTYSFRAEFSDYGIDAESLPAKLAADLALLGFRRL